MTSRKRVGPYEIIGELGRGSFASVFLAKRVGLELPVALKVLTRPSEEEDRARFDREAKVTSALEHPGIVGCFDIGVDEHRGWTYLALEYAPGGTLEQKLRQAPLLVGQALDIGAQLADALAYAHGKGVLHRDLKPANILFDALGRPRIADFGLAACADAQNLTADGDILGTPLTMAPEQFAGTTVDERTDIYALGVVLYYILTGEYPYQGKTAEQVKQRVMRGRPLAPSRRRPEISPRVDDLCLRAMALHPAERFQTMQTLAAALRANMEESIAFAPPPRANALVTGLIAAAAVLLLAATVAVVTAVSRDHAPKRAGETATAPPPPETSPPPPEGKDPLDSSSKTGRPSDPEPVAVAVEASPTVALCLEEIEAWSFSAAKRTLSRARSEAAALSALSDAERRLSMAIKEEERVRREQNELYVKSLRPADALAGVERSLTQHPGSNALRRLRVMLLGVHGRYAEAQAECEELTRRDPTLQSDPQQVQNKKFFRGMAQLAQRSGPAGPTPFAEWIPILGGRWASAGEGVFRGSLIGLGEFGLAALVHRKAGRLAPPYRVSTEIELDCTLDNAFGGVLFGLQDAHNFLLVYVLHDLRAIALETPGVTMEDARRQLGHYPKVLRAARIRNRRWQIIDQVQVRFPDSGWVHLSVEVTPGGIEPSVNGKPCRRIRIDDALDGRVGVLKFYDNVVGFRAFTAQASR